MRDFTPSIKVPLFLLSLAVFGLASIYTADWLMAASETSMDYGSVRVSRVVKVYDGDTLFVDIDSWPPLVGRRIGVRVFGIDTPEMKDPSLETRARAEEARKYVESRLASARKVELVHLRRDKYFRILAMLRVDGRDIGPDLIAQGLARPYFGETKEAW